MRLCVFGDSFVNGTGDDTCLGWVGRVCAAARAHGRDITVYNLGIRGNTSQDVAARWRAEAQARLPTDCDGRLVFSFGANDCASTADGSPRVNAGRTLSTTEEILAEARQSHPTLMIGPPPIADDPPARLRLAALTQALSALCARLEVPFLPVFPALDSAPCWRYEALDHDGAHPAAGGYDELAQLVMNWPAWRQWCGTHALHRIGIQPSNV